MDPSVIDWEVYKLTQSGMSEGKAKIIANCKAKEGFASKTRARDAADYYEDKYHIDYYVYKCPHCHRYHLTTQKQKQA